MTIICFYLTSIYGCFIKAPFVAVLRQFYILKKDQHTSRM